jgi:hypothetical protein
MRDADSTDMLLVNMIAADPERLAGIVRKVKAERALVPK